MKTKPIFLLIVDDDPVFARFVSQMVQALHQDLPCEVSHAENAEAALELIRSRRFDLALVDYHLPGMSGLDLLAEIGRQHLELQPAVIMLTGSGSETVAVEAMKRGARDYLQKDAVEVPSLMRAMQSALTQKRLAEQVAAFHAQMQADLELARKLQDSFLPQSYPGFPRGTAPAESALRFYHRYFWAAQLGGDFFNVQDLSDTTAGVFICDVMGHGVRSALVTAMLRAMIGDLGFCAADPVRFLSEMNLRLAGLLKRIGEPLYATAFYLVADAAAGKMTFANAGHPLPLHVRRRTGEVAPLQLPARPGAALGLFEDAKFFSGSCELEAGDLVVLFTDGLFEVPSPAGEYFGLARLQAAVQQLKDLPAEKLMDELIATVRAFAGGADFSDDVCLLVMEVARTGHSG